jgi:hypothetical protein
MAMRRALEVGAPKVFRHELMTMTRALDSRTPKIKMLIRLGTTPVATRTLQRNTKMRRCGPQRQAARRMVETNRQRCYDGDRAIKLQRSDASPNASEWKTAMEMQLASMRELEVWSVIPRSEATKVALCGWIFKVEGHADGIIERHKARLVAKGFKQRSGVDEVWAPVFRHATVQAFLSTVARRGWEVDQVDVTTTFLSGDLEEDVFMDMPPGFRISRSTMQVAKVCHARGACLSS